MNGSNQQVSRRVFTAAGLGALAGLGIPRLAFGQTAVSQGRSVSSDVQQANIAVVNDFCAAFARKDLDGAVSLLADNCVYRVTHTQPPLTGKEAVIETIKGFMERVVDFKVLNTVALGPLVLNERDDIFQASETTPASTYRVAAGFVFRRERQDRRVDRLLPDVTPIG